MTIAYQQTSREAWESILPVSAMLNRDIMTALSEAAQDGRGPLTCQQIEGALKREHQSVSGNLRHLVEDGLVEKSGLFSETRSGRRAIRWRPTLRATGGAPLFAMERAA